MHIVTRKRLHEFADKHPDARSALMHWHRLIKKGRFRSFVHLRETFPNADLVSRFTLFNVGGNKVRLISVPHFNRGKIFIRAVLTHKEYDAGTWKE